MKSLKLLGNINYNVINQILNFNAFSIFDNPVLRLVLCVG